MVGRLQQLGWSLINGLKIGLMIAGAWWTVFGIVGWLTH